ncbi:MAG: hypothetical protein R3Y24_11045 [Eubacteriales bacterium]
MSERKMDKKNRWRNTSVAFRLSKEEAEELNMRVKLCGYPTKQDYIVDSVLNQKVVAVGNPLMVVQFRKHLRIIEEELRAVERVEEIGEELFTPLRTMLEILEAFDQTVKESTYLGTTKSKEELKEEGREL